MDDLYALKKFLEWLVLPPTIFVVTTAAGVLILTTRRRLGYTIIAVGILVFLSLCTSYITGVLKGLISTNSCDISSPKYIIVLGGGIDENSCTLSPRSILRAETGARLHLLYKTQVIASGGGKCRAEAVLIKEYLENKYFIDSVIVEGKSRDTIENAIYTKKIVKNTGDEVVVVTNNFHMKRALKLFRLQKFNAHPCSIDEPKGDFKNLVSIQNLYESREYIKELIAYTYYSLVYTFIQPTEILYE